MIGGGSRGWERAVREHHAALDGLLASVRDCPPDRWHRPRGAGKWSPAETVEHLALHYQVMLAELGGAPGLPRRAGPIMTLLLRWVLLPHVFFHRTFPVRTSAPRETLPGGVLPGQEEAARKLHSLAGRFEQELSVRGPARLTHPWFGTLSAAPALRFCAVHMEHHQRQIAASTSAP